MTGCVSCIQLFGISSVFGSDLYRAAASDDSVRPAQFVSFSLSFGRIIPEGEQQDIISRSSFL